MQAGDPWGWASSCPKADWAWPRSIRRHPAGLSAHLPRCRVRAGDSGTACPTRPLSAGMGKKDDPKLMQEWFKLVQEKNAVVRYESELMIL